MSLLAEIESIGCLEKVIFRSRTFEASDLYNGAMRNFSQCVKVEAVRNCIDRRWSPFICIMALSSVMGLPVLSIYPHSGDEYAAMLSNAILYTREIQFDNLATFKSILVCTKMILFLLDQIIKCLWL